MSCGLTPERLAYDRNLEPNTASPLDQAGVLGDNARRGAANCAKADDTDAHCSHNFVKGALLAAMLQPQQYRLLS
jgi:hypothetical protein